MPGKDSNLAVMFPQLQHTARFTVMRREGMMRSLTLRGCLIGERRRRRRRKRHRHISKEAGCPPGASLKAAHQLHYIAELHLCRALLCLSVTAKVLWCGPFLRHVHQIAPLLFATYVSSVCRVAKSYVDLPCSSLASIPKRPTPKNKADLSLLLISWDQQDTTLL